MAPGQEYETFLTSMLERPKEKFASAVHITVGYSTPAGERVSDTYTLDFGALEGTQWVGSKAG